MERFVSILKYAVDDNFIFPLFEILFLLLLVYAFARDKRIIGRKNEATSSVKRGEMGWSYLNISFGIASVVMIQIISISESLKGYKVIISMVNLAALMYLMFFNGWFRNKIIGIVSKSKEMRER